MTKLATGLLILLTPLALAVVAPGAYISEVDLTARAALQPSGQKVSIPPLIEISGLRGSKQIELLVLDSQDRASAYARIKQVYRLDITSAVGSTGGSGVMVLAEATWPAQGLASVAPSSVATGPTGQTLDFGNLTTDSRTLVLLDRFSIWAIGTRFSPTDPASAGAQVLDWLTIGPPITSGVATKARTYADEPILDPTLGSVIERPTDAIGEPLSRASELIGFPTPEPFLKVDCLATATGCYPLTPGLANPLLQETHNPEPASVALLGASLASIALIRPSRIRAGAGYKTMPEP